jgi:hypothetical protein
VAQPSTAAEETAANNLSVPAVFVPSVGLTLNYACGTAVDPDDVTTNVKNVFPSGEYYVQGEDLWQAGCTTAAAGTVTVGAEWGDNLTNAPLKARTPIRVEMGLLGDTTTYPLTGFEVVKLTDELDRYATYGTLGAAETPYAEVRVWDAGARLTIKTADGLTTVFDGEATAEINSTGRVVYGFNWARPVAGDYVITFYAPNVTIATTDAGTIVNTHTVTLPVKVASKAGGGGAGQGGGHGGGGGR